MRCEAIIEKYNFKGCGAFLNDATQEAISSGERKLRICNPCESRLKRENLYEIDKINKLIYVKKQMRDRKQDIPRKRKPK